MKKKEWKGNQGTFVWFLEESGQENRPLLLCLVESSEKAESCRQVLMPQLQNVALGMVVIPQGDFAPWEEDVADLVYDLQKNPAFDENRILLTGSPACSNGVWQLASHYPRWFAGVCVVGGYGDPYQARKLKDVPLLVCPINQEDTCLAEGKVLSGAEVTAMGLRVAGARYLQTRQEWCDQSGDEAWNQLFSPQGGGVEWLLSQNRRVQFMVDWIKPGVWRIDDFFSASCYLVEGKEKALLIDTGMGEGDLPGLVASLTPLPVEVAVTHPHLDHMHWIDQFFRVYLHEKDIQLLREDRERFPAAFKDKSAPLPELLPLKDGSTIDLGGTVIQALELSGHTPNSVVFVDDHRQCLFTGDAIGSGDIALMICPEKDAMELIAGYRKALENFLPNLPRLSQYAWLGGHSIQENGGDPRRQQSYLQGASQCFNPIRGKVIEDMIALCDGLLSGEITWYQEPLFQQYHCEFGCAGINFRFI